MINKLLIGLALNLFCSFAFSQEQVAPSVIEKFKTMYPNTTFKEIRKSPINGIYEVVMGKNIAYTDETGRFFVFGHLFDMVTQTDLTAERQVNSNRVQFPSENLAQAIKTVKGDGSRVVAIFSDPDCPYCKHLEAQLLKVDNITIYTFLYPLESLHPAAKAKAIAVWCSPNRAKAWSDLMLMGKQPKLATCKNPVTDNIALGASLRVGGTPTLISADGRVLPGSAAAEKINQWLDANNGKVSTQ